MSLIKLQVKTGNQKYPILIGNNILNKLKLILKENLISFNQCLLIVDKNVPKKLVKKIINSLPKKKYFFIILILVKKIRIKKLSISSCLYS